MSLVSEIGYSFKSTLFDIADDEDKETNLRMYGRELANWIRLKFLALGYDVEEVFSEDWGWCVMCQREPYSLFVGCVSYIDYDNTREDDPIPELEDVIWTVTPFAEVPFFRGSFKKIDTGPGLRKFLLELRAVLEGEPDVEFVELP